MRMLTMEGVANQTAQVDKIGLRVLETFQCAARSFKIVLAKKTDSSRWATNNLVNFQILRILTCTKICLIRLDKKCLRYNFKKEQSIAKETEVGDAEKSIIRCYAEVLIFRQVVIDPKFNPIHIQIFDVLNLETEK